MTWGHHVQLKSLLNCLGTKIPTLSVATEKYRRCAGVQRKI